MRLASGATGQEPVDRVLGVVDRLARLAIVLCIGSMIVIVASQVFARYVLNSSFGWADEVSRLFFVWSIFLAIPIGIRLGAHIGIDFVTARLSGPWRSRLERVVFSIAAALMALVAWQALLIVTQQWDELMVSIDLSAGWFVLALVVGCTHSTLHLARIACYGSYETGP